MNKILQYLKLHGERFDTEIAEAIGASLAHVSLQLSELAANGDIMICHSIQYDRGNKIEGNKCRLAGYIPKTSPGRKSKLLLKQS